MARIHLNLTQTPLEFLRTSVNGNDAPVYWALDGRWHLIYHDEVVAVFVSGQVCNGHPESCMLLVYPDSVSDHAWDTGIAIDRMIDDGCANVQSV
jgi:hypothetical protein